MAILFVFHIVYMATKKLNIKKIKTNMRKGSTLRFCNFNNPKSLQPWAVPVQSQEQWGILGFLWSCWCNGPCRWSTCKPWTKHERESPWSSLHWFHFQQTDLRKENVIIILMSGNKRTLSGDLCYSWNTHSKSLKK